MPKAITKTRSYIKADRINYRCDLIGSFVALLGNIRAKFRHYAKWLGTSIHGLFASFLQLVCVPVVLYWHEKRATPGWHRSTLPHSRAPPILARNDKQFNHSVQ